jgi:hypothetical protein
VHFEPAVAVGGTAAEDVKAIVTMGARIVVEGDEGGRVEGVLPIIPASGTVTPVTLISADPTVLQPRVSEWHAEGESFDIDLDVETVAKTSAVEMSASDGSGSAAGALSILPPPLASFRVAHKQLAAGESVSAVIEFECELAASTQVDLIGNHSGVRFEPSSLIAPARAKAVTLTVLAIDEAQSGLARLQAVANESEVSASLAIVANSIDSVILEPPAVIAGGRARAVVTCLRPVREDVPLRMRANGAVKLVSAAPFIRAGRSRAEFEVEALDVARHTIVEAELDAFGTCKCVELRISPSTSSREHRGGAA